MCLFLCARPLDGCFSAIGNHFSLDFFLLCLVISTDASSDLQPPSVPSSIGCFRMGDTEHDDEDYDDFNYGIEDDDDYPENRPTVILMGHKRCVDQ